MSQNLQARFLRVLQEKEIVRIGDDRVIPIDVRIIAATNRDLLEMVKENSFREDLYYRLCVLQLVIPPLQDRADDIPDLARYFVQQKGRALLDETINIAEAAIRKLSGYDWPGNVRQLENVLERAVVLSNRGIVDEETISEALRGLWTDDMTGKERFLPTKETEEGVLRVVEDEIILRVLNESNGNRSMAAKKLGISVTTLWRKLKQIEKG
jgi:transcriptional regulator with PAS, ATPase and Fis domain